MSHMNVHITDGMVIACAEFFSLSQEEARARLVAWIDGRLPLDSTFVDLDRATGSNLFAPIRQYRQSF